MYKNFFGLRENPFNVNPDPRFLYLTSQTRKTLDELTRGIKNRQGIMLLTGEAGTGKTTLINYLLGWLRHRKMPTAFIFNSHLSPIHLFDFILNDFGIPVDSRQKSDMLVRLNTWLVVRFRAGETPVLIVDEAQGLSFELLEEIRLLLNLETAYEKPLQIVLGGQLELEDKLRRPELRKLQQQIALRCQTTPFTPEESRGYITERLRLSGAAGDPIFASYAMDAVHSYSQGIPRVINLLCEHALINAFVEHLRPVPVRMVEEAARHFSLDQFRSVAVIPSLQEEPDDRVVEDLILAQELVRPSMTDETGLAKAVTTTEASASAPVPSEMVEPALAADNSSVASIPERRKILALVENSKAPGSVCDSIPALSEPCLESMAAPADAGVQLIAETMWSSAIRSPVPHPLPVPMISDSIAGATNLAAQPVAETIQSPAISSPIPPALLYRIPPRGGTKSSPAAKDKRLSPKKDNAPRPKINYGIFHDLCARWMRTLLRSVKAWRTRGEAVILRPITSARRSLMPVAAVKTTKQSTLSARGLLQRWAFDFKRDWMAMMNAIVSPESRMSFYRWHLGRWRK